MLLLSWLLSAFWAWIAAREGNHIGFSGIIYALAAFIFFSGLIRKYYRLMALSGIVIFLYGSMIWGILPIDTDLSWESHLFGLIAGIMLAWFYKNDGPQRPKYDWEIEDKDDSGLPWNHEAKQNDQNQLFISYHYIPKDSNQ